jgi:hypothetical protein
MYCSKCGAEISESANFCEKCGYQVNPAKQAVYPGTYNREWLLATLLCIFVGCFGIHRFYVGKTGTGILMLLTCGGLGIWTLVDLVRLCLGTFTDANGQPLRPIR